jgi:uncharacterized membrane protein
MTTSLAVSALIVTGMMVGVELCVATLVNPIFDRLPGDDGLLGRAEGARVLGRLMPWWYAASLVLCVLLAVLARDSIWAWITAAAAALLVVSILMSVTLLVPINNRAKTWTPGHAPHDWREQLRRWDRLHYVRVAVITAGFACLAVGAVAPTTG